MQELLRFDQIRQVAQHMDPKVVKLLTNRQVSSFIGVDHFDLIQFNWYNARGNKKRSQIALYLDAENLFFFCENNEAMKMIQRLIDESTADEPLNNEQLIFHFFMRLLKNDVELLNQYELQITDTEDQMVSGSGKNNLHRIILYRKDLLRLKRYYSQLSLVFEELSANANHLLSDSSVRACTILSSRANRLYATTVDLRDYISQVLETYQSQLDYRQNSLMKVFTVVTTVFMPLTLLVGWYGMNFDMPEFDSPYSYPIVIVVSIVIVVVLLIYFRKKKWL